jgi:hypothetical protein
VCVSIVCVCVCVCVYVWMFVCCVCLFAHCALHAEMRVLCVVCSDAVAFPPSADPHRSAHAAPVGLGLSAGECELPLHFGTLFLDESMRPPRFPFDAWHSFLRREHAPTSIPFRYESPAKVPLTGF